MKELPLHPLSVILAFEFGQPRPLESVKAIVGDLFDELARAVSQRDGSIIGHIKGLAKMGEADWLRVSIISPARPADVEAVWKTPLQAMDLAVSFMVYNMEPQDLLELTQEVSSLQGRVWSGAVRLHQPTRTVGIHHHHHDHHHH